MLKAPIICLFVIALGLPPSAKGDSKEEANQFIDKGIAAHQKKDYDGAIAWFTKAIRLVPNKGAGYYNRGRVYLAKEDYVRAFGKNEFYGGKNLKHTKEQPIRRNAS